MADIEERAEKWVDEYSHGGVIKGAACEKGWRADLIAAYLAGSAQTQRDYVADFCSRCECSCGAR